MHTYSSQTCTRGVPKWSAIPKAGPCATTICIDHPDRAMRDVDESTTLKVMDHLVHRWPTRDEQRRYSRLRTWRGTIDGLIENDARRLLGERHPEEVNQPLPARSESAGNRAEPPAGELGMLTEHPADGVAVEPMTDRVLERLHRVGRRHTEQHRHVSVGCCSWATSCSRRSRPHGSSWLAHRRRRGVRSDRASGSIAYTQRAGRPRPPSERAALRPWRCRSTGEVRVRRCSVRGRSTVFRSVDRPIRICRAVRRILWERVILSILRPSDLDPDDERPRISAHA